MEYFQDLCIIFLLLSTSSHLFVESYMDAEGYWNYCEGYSVKLFCKSSLQNYEIVIEDVFYGTIQDQCGSESTETCSVSNAMEIIHSACTGKSSCTIRVTSRKLGSECGTENNTLRIKLSCVKKSPLSDVILDGWWGAWSAWGACDVTCGDGTKTRSRTCDDPAPLNGGNDCPGNSTASEICNTTICKEISTTTPEDHCCLCSNLSSGRNLTTEELSDRIRQIVASLSIDKKKLSSMLRKKYSAKDDRTSSVAIGTVAVVFLTLVTICIIGMDAEHFLRSKKNSRKYKYNNS